MQGMRSVGQNLVGPAADDHGVTLCMQIVRHFSHGFNKGLVIQLLGYATIASEVHIGLRWQILDPTAEIRLAAHARHRGAFEHRLNEPAKTVAEPVHPLLFGDQGTNRRADDTGCFGKEKPVNKIQVHLFGDHLADGHRAAADGAVNGNYRHYWSLRLST